MQAVILKQKLKQFFKQKCNKTFKRTFQYYLYKLGKNLCRISQHKDTQHYHTQTDSQHNGTMT
jgi:hypothetical protein